MPRSDLLAKAQTVIVRRVAPGIFGHGGAEQLLDMGTEGALDDETGDVVGRVDDAVALAPAGGAGLFRFILDLTAGPSQQAFEVGNRLLEDVAEDGDADLGLVVVIADALEALTDLVRQGDAVDQRVGLEQAAIVFRDVELLVAPVDGTATGHGNSAIPGAGCRGLHARRPA